MLKKLDFYVNVHAYSDEYQPLSNIPIANCATVWTDLTDNQSYLLVFYEALYFGDRMSNSLICPNQLRDNGLIVHDTPTQFDPNSTHSIRIDDTIIPLDLNGVISGFHSHKPNDDDIENLPRIFMTTNAEWKPYSDSFAAAEEKCRHVGATVTIHKGDPNSLAAANQGRAIAAVRTYDAITSDTLLLPVQEEEEDNLYH